jgi:excisionase family DNA binding protein
MTAEERIQAALAELGAAIVALVNETAAPRSPSVPVELLSVDAFARRAGIGRSTAYLMVAAGDVRSVKVRGRRLIPASEPARLAQEGWR